MNNTRPTQVTPARQPSVEALRRRLRELERMPEQERERLARIKWIPPLEMFRELIRPELRPKDRVERVIVYYKLAHGGDSPNWSQIADMLYIHRGTAFRNGQELLADGRAKLVAGRFVLNNVQIKHPVLSKIKLRSKRLLN